MIQQPEIWRTGRLNLLNDMLLQNKSKSALRAVKVGNKRIYTTTEDMKSILNMLKRKTSEQK